MAALSKKLSLETKIRDAAISLNKLHVTHKALSKPTSDSLEQSNRKVAAAQKELTAVSARHGEVQRKLLEHRSGILSYTVGRLESQLRPPVDSTAVSSGRSTPANGMNGWNGGTSPTSVGTSLSAMQRAKFDGAHLFAGHADSVIPPVPKLPQMALLEERLKAAEEATHTAQQTATAATNALEESKRSEEELRRDLARLRLQKSEIENSLGANLQTAEDTISRLQLEVDRMSQLEGEVSLLREDKRDLETEQRALQDELKERDIRLQDLDEMLAEQRQNVGKSAGMEELLEQVQQASKKDLERKEAEVKALKSQLDGQARQWEQERRVMEDEKMDDLARLQDELEQTREQEAEAARVVEEQLDTAKKALQALVRTHRILMNSTTTSGSISSMRSLGSRSGKGSLDFGEDATVPSLAVAVSAHLESLVEDVEKRRRDKEEWWAARRKLEDDLRSSVERRDTLGEEMEIARSEREDARRDLRSLEEQLRVSTS